MQKKPFLLEILITQSDNFSMKIKSWLVNSKKKVKEWNLLSLKKATNSVVKLRQETWICNKCFNRCKTWWWWCSNLCLWWWVVCSLKCKIWEWWTTLTKLPKDIKTIEEDHIKTETIEAVEEDTKTETTVEETITIKTEETIITITRIIITKIIIGNKIQCKTVVATTWIITWTLRCNSSKLTWDNNNKWCSRSNRWILSNNKEHQ